jgi:hypothetical protein
MSNDRGLLPNAKSKKTPPQIYIVFTYYTGIIHNTNHVRGIYLTPKEALARQKDLIPDGKFGVNDSLHGKDKSGAFICAFTNVFPLGDGNILLHTTSVPNLQQYS